MVNSYYTGEVKARLEEEERIRKIKLDEHREKIRQVTRAYDNMNHYSNSEEQKKMHETIWKSFL
jgi:hypothetical protein